MNVRLRKIRKQDLEKIMNWRMQTNVSQYMYTDPVLTLDIQTKWFEKIKNDESSRHWVISVEGQDIGLFYLMDIDRINSRCGWGYYIADASFRGKGMGRILECNIYDYVFEQLNLNKLWCEVFCFNEKVISIHEKFGSKVEGRREKHIFKNGNFYDIVEMAILKEKWEKTKHKFSYDKITIDDDFDYEKVEFEE